MHFSSFSRFCGFQSTPSARRATHSTRLNSGTASHFNPRPPRGGRLHPALFSIPVKRFQSTPSARRAMTNAETHKSGHNISIHALREEGDFSFYARLQAQSNFNPRPPRGGRLGHLLKGYSAQPFQSTPSVRRATVVLFLPHFISIFQSTPSVRRVTASATEFSFSFAISIHALREEGDVSSITDFFINIISIHALREEGDSKNL